MQWKFDNEIVPSEKWQWIAHYSDGTSLMQFDMKGVFHQFKEIEQDKLARFSMVNNEQHFELLFPKGAKLIHFYRNTIFEMGTPNEARIRLYCFGYEVERVTVLLVIMPDGHLILTDDINKIKVTL